MNMPHLEIDIKSEFLDEAVELVADSETALLLLEEEPESKQHCDHIFRLVHTLKGSAYAANFNELAEFAHIYESLLGHLRSKRLEVDTIIIDLLLKSNDVVREFVSLLEEDIHASYDSSNVSSKVTELIEERLGITEDSKPKATGFHLFDDEEDESDDEDKNSSVEDKEPTTITAPSSTKQADEPQSNGNILLVDDDSNILEVLTLVVEDEGYTAHPAEDGLKALEIVKKMSIDVVISDLKMPGMDGLAFLQKVKEIDKDLPVIMISGKVEKSNLIDFMHYGAYDFIDKPFQPDLILNSIENAMKMYRTRKGVLRLANINFRAYVAIDQYLRLIEAGKDHTKQKDKIKDMLDEIAKLTNMILYT